MSQKNNSKIEDKIVEDEENCDTIEEINGVSDDDIIEKFKELSKEQLVEMIVQAQQIIIESQKKCEELTILCKRVQADFDNYRKRNSENLKNVRQDAALDVIEKFLPVLDIVDQALSMIKDEQILSGIRMMRRQLMEIFAQYDVAEIESFNEEFNPNVHEAVMSEENAEKAGKVLEVLRKGYKIGDKVLRYAAVKVAK